MKKIALTIILAAIIAAGVGCSAEAAGESTSSGGQSAEQVEQKVEAAYELGEITTKVFTNSIGTTWVIGIAPVKNTGTCDLYISGVNMDIEDADGSLVDTMSLATSTPTVISPGETAVLYGESSVDAEGDYKVVPTFKAVKAKIPNTRYPVSDIKISEDKDFGDIEVIGRVENNGDEEESIEVAVIFYGADGSILGAEHTYTDEIAAGSKGSFKISTVVSANDIALADIDHYDVIAYPGFQIQF